MKRIIFLFVSCLLIKFTSDAKEVRTVSQLINAEQGSVCVISSRVDLEGKTVELNPDQLLSFSGGCLSNGTIVGNNTSIKGKGNLFDKVNVRGEWVVPVISTDMFADLSYDDAIRNVFALSNNKVNNVIEINKGDYWVSVKSGISPIIIGSNTTVVIDGNISMRPNRKAMYYVLQVQGSNITLKGKGTIRGDKETHLGTSGEWGMGIFITESDNIVIDGLKIDGCWGDCIYINGKSDNITIKNCWLSNSRRQGVSITSACNVEISNCIITDIGGISPGLAIDVEPNKNNKVEHVNISKVQVYNCEAGISASSVAKCSAIGTIVISDSQFYGTNKNYSVAIYGADEAIVRDCYIESGKECCLWFTKVRKVSAIRNSLSTTNRKAISIKQSDQIKEKKNQIIKVL